MSDFPQPKMIQTNGIEMAVYEAGEGFPVILCHGWPEIAYSWRHQISALSNAGFHAIAPDQRGFGKTTVPPNTADYDIHQLSKDLIGLLDHYGYEKAVFCGHDWGGFVVWHMALAYPDRTAGVIGLNTPFSPRSPIDPIKLMREVFTDKMYIVQFQDRDRPQDPFDADVEKFFRFMMRSGGLSNEEFKELTGDRPTFDIYQALEMAEEFWPGEVFLNAEEMAYFVESFKSSGSFGGIQWYRNFTRNWQTTEDLPQRVTMPSLMITAENDRVLPPSAAEGMPEHCDDLLIHLVRGSGHWTQQEKPQEVNETIINWLKTKFS
jgi:pimeloyl-ACP methyl ester carboxylesterase